MGSALIGAAQGGGGLVRRSVAFALGALLLTGCSTTRSPEPGLSDREWESIQQLMRDSYWEVANLPDDERPPNPPMPLVTDAQWGAEFVVCMNRAGFESYKDAGGGTYSFSSDGPIPPAERLATYLCTVSFRSFSRNDGWYNSAQKNYIYDYYEQVLIPCLALHGAEVLDPPSRAEFIADFGVWHPYFSIREEDRESLFGSASAKRECASMPSGVPDPEYEFFWTV